MLWQVFPVDLNVSLKSLLQANCSGESVSSINLNIKYFCLSDIQKDKSWCLLLIAVLCACVCVCVCVCVTLGSFTFILLHQLNGVNLLGRCK